jgi:putative tryptophan/tyrosine transport system substrate-binding protein
MRRRDVMLLLGGIIIRARALRAQQKVMPVVVGFLNTGSPGPSAPFVAAFLQGLRETGYVEGHNVAIEYRWAEAL